MHADEVLSESVMKNSKRSAVISGVYSPKIHADEVLSGSAMKNSKDLR